MRKKTKIAIAVAIIIVILLLIIGGVVFWVIRRRKAQKPNGTQNPDNTQNTQNPDNTQNTQNPDNTQNTQNPNNTQNTQNPNGTQTPNNTQNTQNPDVISNPIVCINGSVDNGSCLCDAGWTGVYCNIIDSTINVGPDNQTDPIPDNTQSSNTNPCSSKCVNGQQDANCSCICDVGWSGSDCNTLCPNTCVNGQIDQSCVCVCAPGWTGPQCDQKICTNQCVNGSKDSNCNCVCAPGWTGPDCNKKICPSGTCINGTTDNSCNCVCSAGWTGLRCDQKICTNQCVNGSQDNTCSCVCNLGWTGPACNVRVCDNQCIAGSLDNNCICRCDQGWTGVDCGTKINEILPSNIYKPAVVNPYVKKIVLTCAQYPIGLDGIVFTDESGGVLTPMSTYQKQGSLVIVGTFTFDIPVLVGKIEVLNNRAVAVNMHGTTIKMFNSDETALPDTVYISYQRKTTMRYIGGMLVSRVITPFDDIPAETSTFEGRLVKKISLIPSFTAATFKFDYITIVDSSGNALVSSDPFNGYSFVFPNGPETQYGYSTVDIILMQPTDVSSITIRNNRMVHKQAAGVAVVTKNSSGSNVNTSYMTDGEASIFNYEYGYITYVRSLAWPIRVSDVERPAPVSSAPGTQIGYVSFNGPAVYNMAEIFLYAGGRDLKSKDVVLTSTNQYLDSNMPVSVLFDKSDIYTITYPKTTFTADAGSTIDIRLRTPTVIDVITIIGLTTCCCESLGNTTMTLYDTSRRVIGSIKLRPDVAQSYTIVNDVITWIGTGNLPPLVV